MNSENIPSVVKVKSLAEKAILMSISIGVFSTSKKDKKKTNEIAATEGSNVEFARVVKSLLRNKATQEVSSFAQKARNEFKSVTLPWGDEEGLRITKIGSYQKTKAQIEESRRKFYELVDVATEEYRKIVENDFAFERQSLKGMFNRADYPSVHNFRASFYFDINVKPVENSDFRTNFLSDEEIAEINNSVLERISEAVKSAERDILNRVGEKLNHLYSRLGDKDKAFHSSNVTNVCEIIQEMKELNINDNPKLTEVLEKVEAQICGLDGESIRNSLGVRSQALAKTKEAVSAISEAMEDFSF